jgi:hypothetical protein
MHAHAAHVSLNGSPPRGAAITIENEFASVVVERYETSTGARLKVTDARTGVWILLDALELESLAWAAHRQLDALLDPSLGRWQSTTEDAAI